MIIRMSDGTEYKGHSDKATVERLCNAMKHSTNFFLLPDFLAKETYINISNIIFVSQGESNGRDTVGENTEAKRVGRPKKDVGQDKP